MNEYASNRRLNIIQIDVHTRRDRECRRRNEGQRSNRRTSCRGGRSRARWLEYSTVLRRCDLTQFSHERMLCHRKSSITALRLTLSRHFGRQCVGKPQVSITNLPISKLLPKSDQTPLQRGKIPKKRQNSFNMAILYAHTYTNLGLSKSARLPTRAPKAQGPGITFAAISLRRTWEQHPDVPHSIVRSCLRPCRCAQGFVAHEASGANGRISIPRASFPSLEGHIY